MYTASTGLTIITNNIRWLNHAPVDEFIEIVLGNILQVLSPLLRNEPFCNPSID
jgi:hypothetical protein